MTTKTQKTGGQRRLIPWHKRAIFKAGKTRKQREAQYQQQTSVLIMTLLVVVVAGGLFIIFNWQNAGATKTLSCQDYPQYCVPFAGGASGDGAIQNAEAAGSRTLDEASRGADGVVRGFTPDNMPFIGNPNAPIHFAVVADYACSHCNDYHDTDLERFTRDYVLAGKANLQGIQTTGTGGTYSELATQAALCAGEQGAYWEFSDELYRLARSVGVQNGFTLSQLRQSAKDMGLDSGKVIECAASNRYAGFLRDFQTFASDHGVTGTPTLLVNYGDGQGWTKLEYAQRGYDSMKAMTEAANAQ